MAWGCSSAVLLVVFESYLIIAITSNFYLADRYIQVYFDSESEQKLI